MNLFIFNSKEKKFLFWVFVFLFLSFICCKIVYWKGIFNSHQLHLNIGEKFANDVDFAILGDSKTGHFHLKKGLFPLQSYKGLTFSSDSVTPIYHKYTFSKLRKENPQFTPKVVFICTGANNFNANGLHCRRDYTLYNMLSLDDVKRYSFEAEQYSIFAEAIFSRIFPVYGNRVLITHFEFSFSAPKLLNITKKDWNAYTSSNAHKKIYQRNEIQDKNYLDIYQRSVLQNFMYSKTTEAALADLVLEIKSYGGIPIVVLLPVTLEMLELENKLVKNLFEDKIKLFCKEKNVVLFDARTFSYNFKDVNHLSPKGAFDFALEHFLPIIEQEIPR